MLSPFSTVLVVDDNPMARATAVRLFEDLGFKVVDAYNGVGALRLIERHPEIGLLFVMSRLNSPRLLRQLTRVSKSYSRPDMWIGVTCRRMRLSCQNLGA